MISKSAFKVVRALLLSMFVLAFVIPKLSWAADYGKASGPVELTVGFPCCYAATWSAYVVKEKELWKKYLPQGSKINYNIAIAGPPIINGMLADKIQIGYLGDMPAIVLTTKNNVADVRLVATTALSYDQCNILLVRPDAPNFATSQAAVSWLAGKQMGIPRGSCGDRFASVIMHRNKVEAGSYLNQNIEVITSNFRAKKIDAAVVWEPVASQIINQGIAKRVASGVNFNMTDGAFLAMRQDLISARPDIVHDWLEAELDAQLFMSNPKNAEEVVEIVHKNIPNFGKEEIRDALFKRYPDNQGGTDVRLTQPFTFPTEVRKLLADETSFLYSVKGIATPKMRDDAIYSKPADGVLKARGLTSPVGQIKAIIK
jgi:NitT/TauT family transport system substrate-binding protein